MSIKIFASEFKEANWKSFLKCSKENFDKMPESLKNILDNEEIPEDIKVVLIYRLGRYSKEWMYKELPVIDNIKPIDLLTSKKGLKALKEILLRLPD